MTVLHHHRESVVKSWQEQLELVWSGTGNQGYKLTLPEAVGPKWREVTLDDLRYACAVVSAARFTSTHQSMIDGGLIFHTAINMQFSSLF